MEMGLGIHTANSGAILYLVIVTAGNSNFTKKTIVQKVCHSRTGYFFFNQKRPECADAHLARRFKIVIDIQADRDQKICLM